MKRKHRLSNLALPVGGQPSPTPIRISKRTRTVLVVLGVLALVLLMWFAPTVPVVLLGGFALAMALSFPVRWLSHLMPRGLAIATTFLILTGAGVLASLFVVPILIVQLASLVKATPDIAREANAPARAGPGTPPATRARAASATWPPWYTPRPPSRARPARRRAPCSSRSHKGGSCPAPRTS